MRYASNLTAPDLSRHFKLCDPPMRIGNEDMPSDPDFEKECLFWGFDEAAILYTIAKSVPPGRWIDVGSRFGWSAAHVAAAGHNVTLVDPHFKFAARQARMEQNLNHCWSRIDGSYWLAWRESAQILIREEWQNYDGFTIDGCHDSPEPLLDVQDAASLAARNCIIMLHDGYGDPTRDAAKWLMANGWKARFYWTPNGVIAAARGDFQFPDHVRDPAIDWTGFENLVYADIPKGEWA